MTNVIELNTTGGALTKKQLAKHLQVSERTIERWMKAGMPHDRWRNGMVRFHVRDVQSWLRSAA